MALHFGWTDPRRLCLAHCCDLKRERVRKEGGVREGGGGGEREREGTRKKEKERGRERERERER